MTCVYTVGITGASGTIYAQDLIKELLSLNHDVNLVVSRAGIIVAAEELGWQIPDTESAATEYFTALFSNLIETDGPVGSITYYSDDHISAPPASGSYLADAMIVLPCSMGAVASIASGMSDGLLERAADVILKEHRRLVIVPRETPMNAIHLRNLLRLAEIGAYIVPACPSFYQKPQSINDLVSYFTLRVLDQLGIHGESEQRWTDK